MPKKDFVNAKRTAFQLLKFRDRSNQEIYDRLARKGFSEEIISKTIDFLERLKYLNDAEFALNFSQSRLAKPLGLRRIFFELRQKGVDKKIIEQTLQKLKQGYSEFDVVAKIARDKFKKTKSPDELKAKRRVYGLLLRRGFNPETVKDVIEKL